MLGMPDGVAGRSRRSTFADWRSLPTNSFCALRVRNASIWSFTRSKSGTGLLRLSSTLMTCQPNWLFTGFETWPGYILNATSENSGTICSLVK